MRNKVTLDMMDPCGCDCKCIISESDGSNTLQLYMWSVGTNPAIFFQWTDPDGMGHTEADMTGIFLDSGEFYYSANPEIFNGNRLITMWVQWDGDKSRNIYFQCVNLTADTNFTVTRDLSGDDLYRVAAAEDDEIPIATTTSTGVVQIGDYIEITDAGVISVQKASTEKAGVVKVGNGLTVDENGVISASGSAEKLQTTGSEYYARTSSYGFDVCLEGSENYQERILRIEANPDSVTDLIIGNTGGNDIKFLTNRLGFTIESGNNCLRVNEESYNAISFNVRDTYFDVEKEAKVTFTSNGISFQSSLLGSPCKIVVQTDENLCIISKHNTLKMSDDGLYYNGKKILVEETTS